MENKRFCAVIPAYNVERMIGGVVSGALGYIKDVIVVDDGSIDDTSKIAEDSGAVVLRHKVNRGKGDALRTGFEYALKNNFTHVITIDGDGQHDPSDIPKFIEKSRDYDIVVGAREFRTGKMPPIRILSNNITTSLVSLVTGRNVRDAYCGYRAINADILRKIDLKYGGFMLEPEILIKALKKGYRMDSVPIKTIYGDEKSNIKSAKDTAEFIKMIVKSIFW